jgi:acetyl-CoA decarbonylase/synthase, CODH/ACS complex subunit delta
MSYCKSLKSYKSTIRQAKMDEIVIGGESSLNFMESEMEKPAKPVVALEILMNIPVNYSTVLKNAWGNLLDDMVGWAKAASNADVDLLALRFNIDEESDINDEIARACSLFKEIQAEIKKPLIVLGSFKSEIDTLLLPTLAKIARKSCIFGPVEEKSYKQIVPSLIENNHYVIARTPIDINLAKELNILISEMGLSPDRIFIDPNMGALGYGLDYGYSIIERVKLAGLDGDKMLNMPVIVFAGEEAWKSKETKSTAYDENWGSLQDRALIWETMTASSVLAAGANIIVCRHPQVAEKLKQLINRCN